MRWSKGAAVPSWLPLCAISFLLGRASVSIFDGGGGILLPSPAHFNFNCTEPSSSPKARYDATHINHELEWKLNMRRARAYPGITVPLHNGYSAKCIPDATMAQMHADVKRRHLKRTKVGLSDGMLYVDDQVLSVKQVGEFAANNMNVSDDGRPIWTNDLWNHYLDDLTDAQDGGPPQYRNSGRSVAVAVAWALAQALPTCGEAGHGAPCHLSVFSAISPWAEAILFWSASKLRRGRVRITSVDFNPCLLKDLPPDAIAECVSTLDLVQGSGEAFDLTVSYSGIEHDGLGRYGDPVNPNGDVSAMREIWLLTRPLGVLLLAIPCASDKFQPKTSIPIWGNGKIQVLQHRSYGAERYMRLLVGWEMEGFVVAGRDVVERRSDETNLSMIFRMIHCSMETKEKQPLLILRKSDNMTFDDVMLEGDWPANKREKIEREYEGMKKMNQNATC